VRYALLSGHYRQPLNFTFSSLESARSALGKLSKAHSFLGGKNPPSYEESLAMGPSKLGPFQRAWEALLDDLNTPKALGALFSALNKIDPEVLSSDEKEVLRRSFWFVLNALGICLPKTDAPKDPPAEIKELAEKRLQARLTENWAEADKYRKKIALAGWVIKDFRNNYEIVPK